VPLNLEMKLEVWDSPNSAGVVIDALRCAKLAKNNGISGELLGPSAYFMKSPAIQYTDEQARLMVEEFIRENALGAQAAKPKAPAHANGHTLAEAATMRDLPTAE
jgi:myo-inositol-1-phosphate synthase